MKNFILVFLWCSGAMVVCQNNSNDPINVAQNLSNEQETSLFSHLKKKSLVNDWIQENEHDEEDDDQYYLGGDDLSENTESALLKVIKKYLAHVVIVWFLKMYVCKEYVSSRVHSLCACIVTALKHPLSFFAK